MTLQELRIQYPLFSFDDVSWVETPDGLDITYTFSLPPHTFTHHLSLSGITPQHHDASVIDQWVSSIGLVELLSYWKLTCSPRIDVPNIFLTEEQRQFWLSLYRHGMGEYFFKNQIDFRAADFLTLTSSRTPSTTASTPQAEAPDVPHVLVPLGGGKDSIVTGELLRQSVEINAFMVNATPASLAASEKLGCEKPVLVKRTLNPQLLTLNSQGFLNGHVPFSASLAFISGLAAYVGGYTHVAVSNERSSNEGNVEYLDQTINHQYSKSADFEHACNAYMQKYIGGNIRYFSFVRPVYELQISRLFAHMPDFFPVFRSCNRGQKTNSWCGTCPKCLSITITLLPWITPERVTTIFGTNPLERSENYALIRELAGLTPAKPFECVTTTEETLVSLHLCVQAYTQAGLPLPIVLAQAQTEILASLVGMEERTAILLDSYEPNPNMPEMFDTLLRSAYHDVV